MSKPDYLSLLKRANKIEGREELTILLEIRDEIRKNNALLEKMLNTDEIIIEEEPDATREIV